MIDLLVGSINTKRINSHTIGVTYGQEHIDLMIENEIEDEAEKLAKIGYDVTKQNTCIKIANYRDKELSFKCEGNTPS